MAEVVVEVAHPQLVEMVDLVVAVDMLITQVDLLLLDLVVMMVEGV
tara:strand:- start:191 stop:328 length:138 start_codon:yes stop_codon:yes gene_type:complete